MAAPRDFSSPAKVPSDIFKKFLTVLPGSFPIPLLIRHFLPSLPADIMLTRPPTPRYFQASTVLLIYELALRPRGVYRFFGLLTRSTRTRRRTTERALLWYRGNRIESGFASFDLLFLTQKWLFSFPRRVDRPMFFDRYTRARTHTRGLMEKRLCLASQR